MSKTKILIVEDDEDIAKLLKYNLEKAGFDAKVAETGEKAFVSLHNSPPDLVILDIMLPGMDGLEICRSMKQKEKQKNIPVIMLTAKGEEVDRIVGLELGADDYIVKPFSPRELVLRVKAVLKRQEPGGEEAVKEEVIRSGDIVIDMPKYQVTVKNKEIELTRMEFKLLVTLV
ncbi:MAG: response regulator transcription factor, partial [Candidatus Omnitrophica bacterium]|nr:response regulator transcription factor [Candidatus Omnitrophota bacterium]